MTQSETEDDCQAENEAQRERNKKKKMMMKKKKKKKRKREERLTKGASLGISIIGQVVDRCTPGENRCHRSWSLAASRASRASAAHPEHPRRFHGSCLVRAFESPAFFFVFVFLAAPLDLGTSPASPASLASLASLASATFAIARLWHRWCFLSVAVASGHPRHPRHPWHPWHPWHPPRSPLRVSGTGGVFYRSPWPRDIPGIPGIAGHAGHPWNPENARTFLALSAPAAAVSLELPWTDFMECARRGSATGHPGTARIASISSIPTIRPCSFRLGFSPFVSAFVNKALTGF